MKIPRWSAHVVRLLIGGAFLAASILKFANLSSFEEALYTYGLFSHGHIAALTLLVPAVELVLGILMISGFMTLLVGRLAAGLLILFSVVTAVAVLQGQAVTCGCFPTEMPTTVGPAFFVRNVLLIAATLWVAVAAERSRPTADERRPPEASSS